VVNAVCSGGSALWTLFHIINSFSSK
jgi:hypothetical protein